MSKSPTKRSTAGARRTESDIIPERWQHAVAIAVIVLSLIVFFWPVIGGGKTFISGDTVAWDSYETLLKDAEEQGIFPLWNPYVFCGMPGYASLTFGGTRWYDVSSFILLKVAHVVHVLSTSSVGSILFYYLLFGIGMYLLVWRMVRSKPAAVLAALGAVFSTYIVVWIMIGHNTKIMVLAFFPFILLLLERLMERWRWQDALLLVLAFHFAIMPTHVQMTYYVMLAVGIFVLYHLVRALLRRDGVQSVIRVGVTLIAAIVIAFAMDTDRYWSVWEYNPYSIRGSAPTSITGAVHEKTEEGGLDYEYATNWSFGTGELMTWLIPSWYGSGPMMYDGRYTTQPVRVNTYWGPQPFVDGPQYMGIVMLVLAGIGFWTYRREAFVQIAGIVVVLSTLVAFGKEFHLVFDAFFWYMPMFNKFRAPVMILALVQTFIPILAAYGLRALLEKASAALAPAAEKRWRNALVALALLFGLSLVASGLFESIHAGFFPMAEIGPRLAQALQTGQGEILQEFHDFVGRAVAADFTYAFLFLTAVIGAVYFGAKGSLRVSAVVVIVLAASTLDLWRVAKRSMDPKPVTERKAQFTMPQFVQALKQDTTQYRIMQLTNGQLQYDNSLAYWRIQNAYGYQGAKMRAYQDIVEGPGLSNPLVQFLMNVKYIVTNREDSARASLLAFSGGGMHVYRNPAWGPRAFFVNRYDTASAVRILDNLNSMSFNPSDVAFVLEDPKLAIDPPQEGAHAEYVKYGVQDLALNVTATGNNLLFLSEAWYPKGWKAYLNGSEIPILRLNYMFRGVVIPPGTHVLEMHFEPDSFFVGKNISLAANILVLGGLGVVGFGWWRKRK